MIEVFAVNIKKGISTNIFNVLVRFISNEKKEKIINLHRYEDAQQVLISDILVRYLIGAKLNKKNKELRFNNNYFGKPFLCDYSCIHFNLSHSREWIVCALGPVPVGIDIEFIRPIDFDLAKMFFSEYDYKNLMKKKGLEKLKFFYDLWTIKESYVKAKGMGMTIPFNSFSIIISKYGKIICFSDYDTTHNRYNFKQYNISEEYKLCVCCQGDTFLDYIHFIQPDDLCDNFIKYNMD
ncbi:MAG TPA: 4'-phosphopantetheinyl transferase superfamily protein [Epulopiscium sp.]|nr:4'-phosphopantetheinyl transferase superfamily protein [Candidatus Epulonipiscium sp.]